MYAVLKRSHEELFLEQGWLLALGFLEGWPCFRVQHKQWANLEPYSLGTVAAVSNLASYDEVKDSESRRYLDPHDNGLIYHSFWGVTPAPARIYTQFPPRNNLGSMIVVDRTETGEIGYVDGRKSPFYGPFSEDTEIFTVKGVYPALQAYNPLNDSMYNVMLNFAQRQYTYEIIKDRVLIKDMLVGNRRVKKFTMGLALPNPAKVPSWLEDNVGADLLKYSQQVMRGEA
ncbi:MAG: hypothetical protein RX318_11820 [bacterium]|nr:hypothetical protein [bacterium]